MTPPPQLLELPIPASPPGGGRREVPGDYSPSAAIGVPVSPSRKFHLRTHAPLCPPHIAGRQAWSDPNPCRVRCLQEALVTPSVSQHKSSSSESEPTKLVKVHGNVPSVIVSFKYSHVTNAKFNGKTSLKSLKE